MHFNYFPIFSYFLLFFCIFLQFYTKPLQMKIPKYKNMHTKIGRECLHRFQMQFTVYYLTSIYLFPSANSSPPAKYTIPRSPGCHTRRKDCRRSRHRSQTWKWHQSNTVPAAAAPACARGRKRKVRLCHFSGCRCTSCSHRRSRRLFETSVPASHRLMKQAPSLPY